MVRLYTQGNPWKPGAAVWNAGPILQAGLPFFLARTGSPFAPLADWLAGHHLILTGFCRVSSAHAQFFEAKFNAFILTIKWFQQLQLREKIRYKLGPRYTYFSSLAKKVKKKKNVWVYFDPRVAFSNVQKTKMSWKRFLVTIKSSSSCFSVVRETLPQHCEIHTERTKGA